MAISESGKRRIQTHPHTGRTVVTTDTYTILDAWQASDAYLYALQSGSTWVCDTMRAWNSGNWHNNAPPVVDRYIHHEPLAGMSGGPYNAVSQQTDGFRFIKSASPYRAEYGGELNSEHDSLALAMDFRFISQLEFSTGPLGGSGDGARAQRLRAILWDRSNPSAIQTQTIVDIFFDRDYYAANVSIAIPAANDPILIDMAQGDFGDQFGAINSLLIVSKIAANMRKKGSSAASLLLLYELPLAPSGLSWTTTNVAGTFYYAKCFEATQPNSGIASRAWGLLSATFTTFRSETYTTPTANYGIHGRAQSSFPLTADTLLGANLGAAVFNDLRDKGNSSKAVSWPALSLGLRNFGGFPRAVIGDYSLLHTLGNASTFKIDHTASQILEFWINVPFECTRFTMYSQVRFSTGCGLHTIKVELTRNYTTILGVDASATQTLYTAGFASGLPATWVWLDQALSANMAPNQGSVERCKVTLTVTKATPSTLAASSQGYWDGIGALYLAFR